MKDQNLVLEKLIQKGFVTEEQIREISLEGVDDKMNGCADLMHSLFCDAGFHEYRVEALIDKKSYIQHSSICYWYAEQTLETCWQEPTHKRWILRASNEMERQNFGSPKELHDFLLIVTKAAAEIHFLKQKYPHAGELLKELL